MATNETVNPLSELDSLARECAKRQPNVEKAARALATKIGAVGLKDPIIAELCRRAVIDAIQTAQSRERRACKVIVSRRTEESATAYTVAVGLLDRWVIGSKRLGDTTGAELIELAQAERDRAKGHETSARFYELLAAKVPGNRIVRDVMNDEKASALLDDATKESEK